MLPQISVILPVYNADRYLEAAVRSVLAQTFQEFELLVIDDGSSDASWSILCQLQQEDSRIKISTRPNAGLVATLTELIDLAKAPYLARMDADDICLPHRFQRQFVYLEARPDCVAVGSRCQLIDADDLPICEFMDCSTHDEIDAALLAPQLGIVHPSVMLRTAAVRKIGGYRSDFSHVEDLDLFLRLGEIGMLANIQEVLLRYRVHKSSVSHSYTDAQSAGAVQAASVARLRRGMPPASSGELRTGAAESMAELHRKWSWWALGAGNLRTARKHAVLALRSDFAFRKNVHLFACVFRDSLMRRR